MAEEKKKGMWAEFKEFIARGNVMDMAVGIIIGGAFTAIVTSLTTQIINPLISLLGGSNIQGFGIVLSNGNMVDFGSFISACINFLIIALVVFFLVKGVNKLQDAGKKLRGIEEEEEETVPVCPYCKEEVKPGATRCPHCGSEIPAAE